MSTIHVSRSNVRKVDNVIVTDMSRGRILALHDHRRRRVAKKYHRAMVFMRRSFAPESRETLHDIIRDCLPYFSEKARRRVCRALNKAGIAARVER